MLESFKITVHQFIEEVKHSGIKKAFRKSFFIDAEVVPVVKNLENSKPVTELLTKGGLQLIEITKDSLRDFPYSYQVKSRFAKAKRNVKRGQKAFAIVVKNIVVGDIWYVTWETAQHSHLHDDIDLLFLDPGEKDIYMFDMFVDPQQRGKKLAQALMGSALYNLSQRRYQNVFGFFEAKNIPALWTHRMLKFKELEKVYFSRYLFKRISRKPLQ